MFSVGLDQAPLQSVLKMALSLFLGLGGALSLLLVVHVSSVLLLLWICSDMGCHRPLELILIFLMTPL